MAGMEWAWQRVGVGLAKGGVGEVMVHIGDGWITYLCCASNYV